MSAEREKLAAAFEEAAAVFWKGSGSRMTVVRRIICRELGGAGEPLDAETLLRRVREQDRQISQATVYRTLGSLSEGGLLVEVEGREGKKRYQAGLAGQSTSSHIICQDCGFILPLEDPCLGLREGARVRGKGFIPEKISLRMEAHCERLRRTGRCDQHASADRQSSDCQRGEGN
jgi:Fur family ferric uptake transcriptional regulator